MADNPYGIEAPTAPQIQQPWYQRAITGLLGTPSSYGGLLSDEERQAAQRQAIMAMGANLMQSSGPSPYRTSLGQALGGAIQAGQQSQGQATEAAIRAAIIQKQMQPKPVVPKQFVVNGHLVNEDGTVVYSAPQEQKPITPPQSRTVARGSTQVLQDWDPATNSWKDSSVAPRWQPQQPAADPQPPSGYRKRPDGTLEFIPGGPADPAMKPAPARAPTEFDKKAKVLIQGMSDSEEQINQLEKKTDPTGIWNAIMGSVPLTGKTLQTDDYRAYQAAAKRWAANYLYMKSGAQAGADEIASVAQQFFPQAGEGKEIAAQKKAARLQEMQGAQSVFGDPPVDAGGTSPSNIDALLKKYGKP